MAITTRAGKGSELTHAELDTNFTDLRDGLALMVPKVQNSGIKVDSLGTPTYPWVDLLGHIEVDPLSPNNSVYSAFLGGIKAHQFIEGSEAYIHYHLPHDYVMGSNVFIHVHWLHNSSLVTGGSVTWGMEVTYAKGHNQGAFITPISVSVIQAASTIANQHMIAETALSVQGGSPVQLDTDILEPDGVIMCRLYCDSNDMTVSSGLVPAPFVLTADLHYQSTSIGTKQRSPDFWT